MRDKIIECAKKLQAMGGRNILVSMAGDGALLLDQFRNLRSEFVAFLPVL